MNPSRRNLVKWLSLVPGAAVLGGVSLSAASAPRFVSQRPPVGKRKFTSEAVEKLIASTKKKIADPELAWLFENCFPNTLDTTVELGRLDGYEDTFVVTGDIDAMWLRDSSAQVWPSLPLTPKDEALRKLFRGLIRRQARRGREPGHAASPPWPRTSWPRNAWPAPGPAARA